MWPGCICPSRRGNSPQAPRRHPGRQDTSLSFTAPTARSGCRKALGLRGRRAGCDGRPASARRAFLALPCSLGFRFAASTAGNARLPQFAKVVARRRKSGFLQRPCPWPRLRRKGALEPWETWRAPIVQQADSPPRGLFFILFTNPRTLFPILTVSFFFSS